MSYFVMKLQMWGQQLTCGVQWQFLEQYAAVRSADGDLVAHMHGTQFGYSRLSTADGKIVLSAHSLYDVVEFGYAGVRLKGLHPRALAGKYVDLSEIQWDNMFKLVRVSDLRYCNKR